MEDRSEGWTNPKVLAILTVLFVCGIACGSLITTTAIHWRMHSAASGQLGLSQLKTRLHLTPQQEHVVTEALDDYVKYYQNIEEEREDVAEHGKQRILSVLNPEQKKIFLKMFRSSGLPTKTSSE
jgi:hypothetical protein